jgi:hypothetical protein
MLAATLSAPPPTIRMAAAGRRAAVLHQGLRMPLIICVELLAYFLPYLRSGLTYHHKIMM